MQIQIPKGYPRAFDLPQATNLEELYQIIVAIREHLNSIDTDWAMIQPDAPRSFVGPWGVSVGESIESFALRRRYQVACTYHGMLRVQVEKIWNAGMPPLPPEDDGSTNAIFGVLMPWIQRTLSRAAKKATPAKAHPVESMAPKRPNRLDRALQQYQRAIEDKPQLAGNYPAAYQWFREHFADDPDELPNEGAWANYVRKAMRDTRQK
jgi:hypothetical protein